MIKLEFSATRRIRAEWFGPTPADLGLRWLRRRFARGWMTEVRTAVLEWRGTAVEGEREVTLPNQGRAEWSIKKRFENGTEETTPFVAVTSDLLAVQG